MNDLKEFYIAIIAAIFIVGLVLGALLFSLFTEDCKTREQLCIADIQQNKSLKETLSKQELLCSEKIDSVIKITLKNANHKFSSKYKRLEQACNQLDCAQCRR